MAKYLERREKDDRGGYHDDQSRRQLREMESLDILKEMCRMYNMVVDDSGIALPSLIIQLTYMYYILYTLSTISFFTFNHYISIE